MAYTPKPNSGSSFKNKKKEKETHPDYTGTCVIDGNEYYISTWIRNAKSHPNYDPNKQTYFSHAFKLKGAAAQESAPQQSRRPEPQNLDDQPDIPF